MSPETISAVVDAVGAASGVVGSASDPIATQSVGWSKAAVGIWTLVGGGGLYALPRFIIQLRKLFNDRGDQLDEERRDDMKVMRAEIALIKEEAKSTRERANRAERAAMDAETRLSTAMVVIKMLSARIEAEWPNDPTLSNIHTLIEATTPQEHLYVNGLHKLASDIGSMHTKEVDRDHE